MSSRGRVRGGLALVVPFFVLVAGCDQLFGLDEVQIGQDNPNAYVCGCTCFAGERDEIARAFPTCMPPALNLNVGGTGASPEALAQDCNSRVRDTFVGIVAQCGSNTVRRRLQDDPSLCTCAPTFVPTFVSTCNGTCQSVPLASDCSNRDAATSVGSLDPVCIAEEHASGTQTMARVLYGERSTCEVSGQLSVARGSDAPQTDAVSGVMEIAGAPCPGASCSVDVFYRLADSGSLRFEGYAGLASATFRDIRLSGRTSAPVLLDAAGAGEAVASTLTSAGRGTREEEALFGTISDTITRSYTGANVDPVDVVSDWQARQCAMVGSLLDAEVEGETLDMVIDVVGTLVGQPPRADAGPDRQVECTSASGASVVLSGSASTDPDLDLRFREWWLGAPGPSPIADADGDGVVSVAQALGASTDYTLTVIDGRASVSQDAVRVSVVDTTAPTIASVSASPSVLRPRNHALVPVTVSVSSTDRCGTSTCAIRAVRSSQPVNATGDGNTTPIDWVITGPLSVSVRAETAGGVDRIYTIEIACSDAWGNEAAASTQVRVVARR